MGGVSLYIENYRRHTEMMRNEIEETIEKFNKKNT